MPEIHCTACGTPIPAGSNFCTSCGAKAPEAPPPAPMAPQPLPQAPAMPAPERPAPPPAPVPAAEAEKMPLRFWDYLLMLLVFSVPLAGTVIASMWAFGWALGKKTKKDRRDFALAQFVVSAAFILAFLVFYFVNFSAMNEFFKVMLS